MQVIKKEKTLKNNLKDLRMKKKMLDSSVDLQKFLSKVEIYQLEKQNTNKIWEVQLPALLSNNTQLTTMVEKFG